MGFFLISPGLFLANGQMWNGHGLGLGGEGHLWSVTLLRFVCFVCFVSRNTRDLDSGASPRPVAILLSYPSVAVSRVGWCFLICSESGTARLIDSFVDSFFFFLTAGGSHYVLTWVVFVGTPYMYVSCWGDG